LTGASSSGRIIEKRLDDAVIDALVPPLLDARAP
jgi:hypothetical protein